MARDGYKEIEVKRNMQFEEDADPVVVEIDLDDAAGNTEINEEVQKQEEQTPVVSKEAIKSDDKEKKRQSRAKERIKQLLAERDEALAIAEQERQKSVALEQKLNVGNKSTKESLKSSYEGQVQSILKRMGDALKAGDTDETVNLTDELTTVRMKLASVSADLQEPVVEVKEQERPIRRQSQSQVNEKAHEWVSDHPEFNTDELFRGTSLFYNNQLLSEGWDANSDDFYEELNSRLSKRFPEVFGIAEKTSVELSDNDDSSSAREQDVKKAPAKARTTEQTVSGSSRSVPAKNIQTRRPQTVELSKSDLIQAERWGLTPKQMARRMLHTERTKRTDGYSPIMYSKDE